MDTCIFKLCPLEMQRNQELPLGIDKYFISILNIALYH